MYLVLVMNSRLFHSTYAAAQFFSTSRQFSQQFRFLGKMTTRKSYSGQYHSRPRIGDGQSPDVPIAGQSGYSNVGGKILQSKMFDNVSEHPKSWTASDPYYEEERPSLSACGASGKRAKMKTKIDLKTQLEQSTEERVGIGCSDTSQFEGFPVGNLRTKEDECMLPVSFGKKHWPSPVKRRESKKTHPKYSVGDEKRDSTKDFPVLQPFDICLPEVERFTAENILANGNNVEEQAKVEGSLEMTRQILRPGMVLLKGFITLGEQVDIVKKCTELGLGPGGFYQPGYSDGAKLRLQMMCLGLDWDPETRAYSKQRVVDCSEAPDIPHQFNSLVKKAIQDSRALIREETGASNVEDILPDMSPEICIVNFYTTSGRLGLHQDRDESKESRQKGLPVVSFSIGDSAEFLYGDRRDAGKTQSVLLESGDVVIFGGKSRHIFHGVRSIIPNTAPISLLEEVRLRPGRLNLTFRQY